MRKKVLSSSFCLKECVVTTTTTKYTTEKKHTSTTILKSVKHSRDAYDLYTNAKVGIFNMLKNIDKSLFNNESVNNSLYSFNAFFSCNKKEKTIKRDDNFCTMNICVDNKTLKNEIEQMNLNKKDLNIYDNDFEVLIIPKVEYIKIETLKSILEIAKIKKVVFTDDYPKNVAGLNEFINNKDEFNEILKGLKEKCKLFGYEA